MTHAAGEVTPSGRVTATIQRNPALLAEHPLPPEQPGGGHLRVVREGELPQGDIPGGISTANVAPAVEVLKAWPSLTDDRCRLDLSAVREFALPHRRLSAEVYEWRLWNLPNIWRGLRTALAARALRIPTQFGALWGVHYAGDGTVTELGLMSMRVVTTTGVGFIVDAFQNIVELENMKFHALGTGNTAEAAGDTALVTELTTQYNPDNTRATGTTTEASATVYRTVATNTVDASATVVEHGILSQAATGGGVLLDRSVFGGLALVSSDGLQTTYDHTQVAGS